MFLKICLASNFILLTKLLG